MRRYFIFLFWMAVAAALVLYCNFSIDLDPIPLWFEALPQEFDGYRVLLLTDLHGRSYGEQNEKLLHKVREAKPDMIALGGDLLDAAEQTDDLRALVEALTQIAPTCAVTGNHEWAAHCINAVQKLMEEAGVIWLDDSYCFLERDGAQIALAGFCDPNGNTNEQVQKALIEAIRRKAPDVFILLLNHRNEAPERFADLGVGAVLSGHGHGGVIRLPFFGGLLGTDRRLFPQYTSGAYPSGGTTLVVSRGLGGVRLLSRPHLPLIELRSGKHE